MSPSIACTRKKPDPAKKSRGRPPTGWTGIHVALMPEQLKELNEWIGRQDDKPSRPEAIRRLLADALKRKK